MKTPNATVFLLCGFYLSLFLYQIDVVNFLGSKAVFFVICSAFLPAILILRRRLLPALSLAVMTLWFIFIMLVIQQLSISVPNFQTMLNSPPFPVYAFLIVLLPGIFMVSELDHERLPHELSHWSGLRIFRPLIAVFAGRERVLRRLSAIRETCQLRGVELNSGFQHLHKFHVWIVPLVAATICEAAYAFKFREMLGSAHSFIPTHPKKPVLSPIQKIFISLLILDVLWGVTRLHIWIAT